MCHPSGLAAHGTGVSSDRDAIKSAVRPRARNESQTLKRKPSWMIAGGVNGFGYPVKAQHMEGRPVGFLLTWPAMGGGGALLPRLVIAGMESQCTLWHPCPYSFS